MTTKLSARLFIASTILGSSLPLHAADEPTHSHAQEAHVHGAAELLIAFEKSRVEIVLNSPAANIFGFEHRPSTREQREQVQLARSILQDYKNLIRFTASDCKAVEQDVHLPYEVESLHHEEHEESGHHEDHDNYETHSEITATYKLECGSGTPESAYVPIFDHFPGIENLHVQWISNSGQGATQLSVKERRVHLR